MKTIGQRITNELECEGMLNRNMPNFSGVAALIDKLLHAGLPKCNECGQVADYWAQQYPQDPPSYRCERHLNLPPECKADLTPADFHPIFPKFECE